MQTNDRNYSSISPSAKALLLMKGLTPIPYARQAATLITAPEPFVPDHPANDVAYWGRVAHFETRYNSISTLLDQLPVKNMLELSAGFSFRGLDLVQRSGIHYIDTDLPGIIEQKQAFVDQLQDKDQTVGKLEILPLNALDEAAFNNIVHRFGEGPLAIINEGLLMYLDEREKTDLCRIIRGVLEERGGYWITADIYLKIKADTAFTRMDDELQKFLDEHKIEENKFESIEAAKAFFEQNGFVIDQEAVPDYAQSSALKPLLANTTDEQRAQMQKAGRIHTTWRLKLRERA